LHQVHFSLFFLPFLSVDELNGQKETCWKKKSKRRKRQPDEKNEAQIVRSLLSS
jgi:hypothetical protein